MSTDAIQMICDRLGTTVNQLVPEVIRYETKMNSVGLIIGVIITVISLLCLCARIYFAKHSSYDMEVPFLIIGVIGLTVGLLMTFIFVSELIALNTSPQIYAYKTIFGWIGGN